MAQTIKLKRSATTGNAPTTSQLALGELGINTTDGKLFLKKSVSGTESIVEVGDTSGYLPLSGGTLTGNLSLGDNVKLQLGNQTNGDLQLYHDGNHSWIKDAGAGNIYISSDGYAVNIVKGENTAAVASFIPDGPVNLYNAGDLRLATTSTGIDVTGSVVADGLTSELGSDAQGKFSGWSPTGSTSTVHGAIELGSNASYQGIISYDGSNNTRFLFDNAWSGTGSTFEFRTNTAATAKTHLKIEGTGDISFYDSAGTSQNLFWDSSTSRLGLGTTAPSFSAIGSVSSASKITGIEIFKDGTDTATALKLGADNGSGTKAFAQLGYSGANGSAHFANYNTSGTKVGELSINADGSSVFSGAVTSTGAITTSTRVLSPEFRVMEGTSLAGGIFKEKNLTGSGSSLDLAIFAEGISNGGDIHFYTGGALPSKMTIASNGNVNIPNGSLMVGSTTAPEGQLTLQNDDAYLRIRSNTTTTKGLTLRYNHAGNFGQLLVDHQGNNQLDMKYHALSHTFGRSDSQQFMTIDSSGRVGIGSSTGASAYGTKLFVEDSSAGLAIFHRTGSGGLTISADNDGPILGSLDNADSLRIFTGSAERMRLNSDGSCRWTPDGTTHDMTLTADGNLLVGRTSASGVDTDGHVLFGNGVSYQSNTDVAAQFVNRNGTDGSITSFYKNGTTVGSIGTASTSTYIDGGSEFSGLQFGGDGTSEGRVVPRRDGAIADGETTLGTSLYRFKDLYLSNNATAQKLTLTKAPVGTYTIEVDGTNTGQPNLIVKQSTSERLRIDNLGRVGIGTSSPIRVLDIATTTGGTIIHLTDDATGHTATDGVDIQQEGTLFQILNREAGDIRFGTDNATRMTITSAGNVGIGTSSPDTLVHAYKASNAILKVAEANGYASLQQSGVNSYLNNVASGGSLIFRNGTAPTERMRIDSSGNLLVGTTDSTPYNNNAGSTADNGIVLSEAGWLAAARYQGTVAFLNRTDNDGDIAVFRRDGTTVGSIGSLSGTQIVIDSGGNRSGVRFEDNGLLPRKNSAMADGTVTLGNPSYKFSDLYLSGTANVQYAGATDTGIYFNGSFNAVVPYRPDTGVAVDDYLDLGVYSHRWDDIFATNGTIQTSDRNEKQDIEDLTEAEERVAVAAKGLLKKFRWKSAVEDKGDDARIHFGIIAQDLQDAFEAEGLDAGRYGMFTSNTWTNEDGEEQTRMGVRYSELLAFIISAI